MAIPGRRTLVMVTRRGNRAEVRVYKREPDQSRFERVRTYRAVLGRKGFETPRGVFTVAAKTDRPDWMMPNSSWVKLADRGKVIPFGDPRNPLLGAFISIDGEGKGVEDGIGFHGSADLDAGGGSHGCIRMSAANARDMYRLVGVGTPVVMT